MSFFQDHDLSALHQHRLLHLESNLECLGGGGIRDRPETYERVPRFEFEALELGGQVACVRSNEKVMRYNRVVL